MTPRHRALLDYHRDVASLVCNSKHRVFVILDLEDSVGLEIAFYVQANCAEKRDAIKERGAYPALTLALPVNDANALLAHGWPNGNPIGSIPEGSVALMLISEGRCVVAFLRRE